MLGLPYYAGLARTAERGHLDAMFAADNISIAEYRAEHMPQALFDPVELMCALSGVTERIGLIATGSTTYSAPWDLARRFATLDHLSGGRAGWNIVTTRSVLTAANFGGSAHPSAADRYAQAGEFVEVVRRVWDSWEDGAVIADRDAGVWADRAKLHAPRFVGRHYEVAGILPFPRAPQGHPVLVQAGSSPAGVALAARHAELVFTRQPSLGDAVAFRRRLHELAQAAGRRPEHLLVLPALTCTLAATETEALARQAQLEELASAEFRWQNMLWMIGLDPDGGFDPDEPLPAELVAGPAPSSGAEPVFAAARREAIPLRELARRHAGNPNSMTFVGAPEQLADFIDEWSRAGAADGFTVMPTTLPDGLEAFVDGVVPILRARGRFRHDYAGATLREHLGLPRPGLG